MYKTASSMLCVTVSYRKKTVLTIWQQKQATLLIVRKQSANKLSLSIDKTCYSLFGASDSDRSAVKLNIADVELKQVESTKYLGIMIDHQLNWSTHIDLIYKKLIKFTSIFYKLRTRLPFDIKKMIYFAFVHSQLSYGIEIYGNTYPTYLNKLTTLNNKILQILQEAPRQTRIADLYNNFNALMLPNLHKFNILLFMHKFFYHKDQLPRIFHSYFQHNSELHSYNTRTKNEPHLKLFNSSIGQRSVKFKGTRMWCSLPEQLRSISSTRSFKRKLKEFLQHMGKID